MSLLRRKSRWIATAGLVLAATAAPRAARAGDPLDLEDDEQKPDAKDESVDKNTPVMPPAPVATIKPHAYTLAECLALADRNHPNLWAAKARVGAAHAQLEEA